MGERFYMVSPCKNVRTRNPARCFRSRPGDSKQQGKEKMPLWGAVVPILGLFVLKMGEYPRKQRKTL